MNFKIKLVLKIIISTVYLICRQLYSLILRLVGKKIPGSCIIIFFHSIRKEETDAFIKKLDYLINVTTPISIDYNGSLQNGVRYSIITFDDAFQSAMDNAVPELIERKVPFTIFIPTGQLGEKPGWLCNTGDRDEDETITTMDQLLKLDPAYASFGSHSVNHAKLTLLDDNEAYEEIKLSKDMLESHLKYPVKVIAFPYGLFDQRILNLCKNAGYRQVFTIENESPYLPLNKFEKGRVGVNPTDWMIDFRLKIFGAYSWMPIASSIKRKLIAFFD
jgi:peptidoglycan/xylan/chitin deacetylase (PgdA/CDA1 family)